MYGPRELLDVECRPINGWLHVRQFYLHNVRLTSYIGPRCNLSFNAALTLRSVHPSSLKLFQYRPSVAQCYSTTTKCSESVASITTTTPSGTGEQHPTTLTDSYYRKSTTPSSLCSRRDPHPYFCQTWDIVLYPTLLVDVTAQNASAPVGSKRYTAQEAANQAEHFHRLDYKRCTGVLRDTGLDPSISCYLDDSELVPHWLRSVEPIEAQCAITRSPNRPTCFD